MWDGMGGLESGKTPQGKHAHRKMSRMQTKPIWVQSTQAWPTVPGVLFSGQFTFDAVVWHTLFASQQPAQLLGPQTTVAPSPAIPESTAELSMVLASMPLPDELPDPEDDPLDDPEPEDDPLDEPELDPEELPEPLPDEDPLDDPLDPPDPEPLLDELPPSLAASLDMLESIGVDASPPKLFPLSPAPPVAQAMPVSTGMVRASRARRTAPILSCPVASCKHSAAL